MITSTRTTQPPDVYACGVALGELQVISGGPELVLASGTDLQVEPYSGRVRAFTPDGSTLWTYESPLHGFGMDVCVGDVDDDGVNEIAAAFNYEEAKVYLLNNDGSPRWSWAMHGAGFQYARGVAIGKVRQDHPGKQVVVSGYNSQLALLDYQGNEIWHRTIGGTYTVQTVAIMGAEILCAYRNYVKKYDAYGNQVWSTALGTGEYDSVITVKAGHVTSLEEMQVAATVYPRFGMGSVKRVVLLTTNGNEIWRWDCPHGCSGLCLADVDGDGYAEVIVGYGNHDNETPDPNKDAGGVTVLDSDGSEMASLGLPSTVGFIAYGDADNDGQNEIVASCDDGKAYILKLVELPMSENVLDHVPFSGQKTVTGGAPGVLVVTSNPVELDGATPIMVTFFCPRVLPSDAGANRYMVLTLWEDTVGLGQIGLLRTPAAGKDDKCVCVPCWLPPPSAGTHTYSVRAWVSAGTGYLYPGAGGNGNDIPGYLRITEA